MKSNSLKNRAANLPSGFTLVGKWHSNPYTIRRKLGSGATGTVYLAEDGLSQMVALKIAVDNMAITSEVNVLKHFSKVDGKKLGPKLLDVDDMMTADGTLPFYVMEYLKGDSIIQYLNGKGAEWLGLFVVQLLGDLEDLHVEGWVFGDLKPDNLMIVGPPPRVRWIDVGGTTLLGRSIKEYTEFYDRGYWGLGTRKAEPSYDLFAVAMIMINCDYSSRFDKGTDANLELLEKKINQKERLQLFKPILLRALTGKYQRASEMKQEVVELLAAPNKEKRMTHKKKVKTVKPQQVKKKKRRKSKGSSYIVEIFLIISLIILVYILYLFGQTM
ncbi:serine/threonine protein kinase [Alkalihalobacillus sp. 1P02AB]|uniref:serine/threonine protein kinase n=1 Tax=Alkalihalobacillus sp. 1P02AB TaxID=3132260 RepID=UPI0039A5C41E